MKRILIIGGMGPQASLELHSRIISAASSAGAHHGEDFPEIVHASLPIADFISDTSRLQPAADLVNAAMSQFYIWRWSVSSNCL